MKVQSSKTSNPCALELNAMFFYSRRWRYYKRSDPAKYDKAYQMRHNPTRAEAAMLDILSRQVMRRFPDHIFRRQQVRYGYILDFYCQTLRLGIEVDGDVHDTQEQYDWNRDNALARRGIQTIRFTNKNVLYNTEVVASELCQIVEGKTGRRFVKLPARAMRRLTNQHLLRARPKKNL